MVDERDSLDGCSSRFGDQALVWSSLARKRFGFNQLHTCILMHSTKYRNGTQSDMPCRPLPTAFSGNRMRRKLASKMVSTQQRLCKVGDLPSHLQFNKDILSGYRRPMNSVDCVRSWWGYVHNESFNCYSHGVALVYFTLTAYQYRLIWPNDFSSPNQRMVAFFILADFLYCTLPFLFSITYHTFMPHSSGAPTYYRLLKTDIFGVWLICTFGPLSNFYTGLYCSPDVMSLFLAIYFMLSAAVLYYLMVQDCKRKRVAALTAQFILRILIHPLRLSLSQSSTDAVYYYIIMDIITSIGALVNSHHVPERWLPGKVDYVFNGHSLMHVAAIFGLLVGKYGFYSDMHWLSGVGSCSTGVSQGVWPMWKDLTKGLFLFSESI